MDDKLSFLSGEGPAEPAIAPAETPAPILETPAEGPARGADGKFISQDQPAEPAPEPPPQASVEPGHVPISALMDERDKRQEAEKQRKALEERIAALQAAQQPPRVAPDMFDDPEGHQAFLREEQQRTALITKLEITEDLARSKYGDALINDVQQWLQANPRIAQEGIGQRNPYEFAVQAFQRDKIASQFQPSDLDDFRAWQAAKAAGIQPPAASAAPPQSVSAPPRSLASATSAGGAAHIPTGDGQAFDALFKR